MGAFGVTPTGFVKKTLAVIVSEYGDSYRSALGSSVNLNPPSLVATTIGIAAEREAAVWDIAEEAWNARGASTSQDVSLDNVGELTGESRLEEKPSQIFQQIFFGVIGTVIPTNFVAAVSGNPLATFSPKSSVTLVAGTNAVQKLSFSSVPDAGTWTITMPDAQVTGALAYGAAASVVQAAVRALIAARDWSSVSVTGDYTAGFTFTFSGNSGLQPQNALAPTSLLTHTGGAVAITQSTTTVGVPQALATMIANTDGPIVASARTLTVINTPITGLTSTLNIDDATLGRLEETDAEYRLRREQDLQSASTSTLEAIRIQVKKVLNVTEAIVYENVSLVTDGNGVPGKSLHVYVSGGIDADVARGIFDSIGAGINTYGGTTVSVTDSQGLAHSISFDRPTLKPVYVVVTITKDPAAYPATGDTLVENAIAEYGTTLKIGDDVLLRPKLLPAIVDNVPGILDLTVTIGFAPAPGGTANLVLAPNELATFSTANMTVTSS